ncbi:MAG: 1-deoxy-D-xylulose-5-phosphate reductoisomerase [Bacilli bacterium]|jgi:1-deoxy-D-xylulose-5-phosphate reductoisomerase|nr:1-deoxy-D-xylulose-5-phosphate reductoisomerase [Bacilli bacterium]
MKKILLLGASGSIGRQTIDILQSRREDFSLLGFSVGNQDNLIVSLITSFPEVQSIFLLNKRRIPELSKQFPHINFFSGEDGIKRLIESLQVDLMINALVGFIGLEPTILALQQGIDVATANKEALVVGGKLINEIIASGKVHLYPIDSEHVAISKALKGNEQTAQRLILTASGGPFLHLSRTEMTKVTVQEALHHPSWKMGKKITIDSATLMNKGFEIIEAHYLFNFPVDKIDVLFHPESKIHSLVYFADGSYLADIGPSDMRIPIGYALYGGQRKVGLPHNDLTLDSFPTFHFEPLDDEKFPLVSIAKEAIRIGGSLPCVLNAANEVAVYAFLEEQIPFLGIEEVIKWALDNAKVIGEPSLEELIAVDKMTRTLVTNYIKGKY